MLRRLPAGRWWPPLDRLLIDLQQVTPDQFPDQFLDREEAGPGLLA